MEGYYQKGFTEEGRLCPIVSVTTNMLGLEWNKNEKASYMPSLFYLFFLIGNEYDLLCPAPVAMNA